MTGDHPNDYWPYEVEEGFCGKCRKFINHAKQCKHCGNVKETDNDGQG